MEERLKIYTDFEEKYPRASAPRRIPLNFAEGTFDTYVITTTSKLKSPPKLMNIF